MFSHQIMNLIIIFAYPPKTILRPPDNFELCGKTFGQIKQEQHLLDIIYSLGIIIVFIFVVIISVLLYRYKIKKLNEERMRLIV
jgi:hypothetical protein